MKERPILFSGEMVRAILEGHKTQTRRVIKNPFVLETCNFMGCVESLKGEHDLKTEFVKNQERISDNGKKYNYTGLLAWCGEYPEEGAVEIKCPYGKPGDRLWVRETHKRIHIQTPLPHWDYIYQEHEDYDICAKELGWKTVPSIHMPRWASRLAPFITEVRVERVQEITEEDAKAEGAQFCDISSFDETEIALLDYPHNGKDTPYKNGFSLLWDSINAKRGFGWDVNPWVWVIVFKRVDV